jgi:hypothetical protein
MSKGTALLPGAPLRASDRRNAHRADVSQSTGPIMPHLRWQCRVRAEAPRRPIVADRSSYGASGAAMRDRVPPNEKRTQRAYETKRSEAKSLEREMGAGIAASPHLRRAKVPPVFVSFGDPKVSCSSILAHQLRRRFGKWSCPEGHVFLPLRPFLDQSPVASPAPRGMPRSR